ncbi:MULTISPECIES: 2,3,4,5-tetrahydropyridine-2,6-dicarboxylate N-succinyltransferase [Xanthomonas]|uniref:2,3,4,5-tetrahydropyridine-2,6-dicarboxylate N-succinyltransferase n=1 Tax=Xanthomonas axonopodis pv. melhusii TaxID=487834 RepID=A0A1T1NT49_9XANT|nr:MULTISPECIES: 2,3,4,5-tetrahydropyridine-2,6-dicarboxylate N-succinyltransferase [Xanthomonas]OOW84871.1 2,3,4,5-tetrahydropyridine-2,6-dicarboxylate N-succinyltransferase [Xanthomonas campestris pv. vitistrifoliae]OOW94575.1 2,3,4,5-tetrahydropyridine-2,6-dicarboxylate N-succinyltransferase [Xanthomonas campestris pv. vitiscarnosae]OOW66312.1 2,3,4,5-tetrahydropyridine-2,6-dicarboxylate N-succinyltransferase [Xanthomonas axonopodis pv. melhusii]OOW68452.1 2,3,4,5-tetrahydropyridine-2,6-dica
MATSKKTAPKQSATTTNAASKRANAPSGKAAKVPAAADSKPGVGVGKQGAAAGAVGKKTAASDAASQKTVAKKTGGKTATSAAPRVARQPTKVVAAPAAKKAAAAKKLPIAEQAVHSASTQVGSDELKLGIESAFERRATLTMDEIDGSTRAIVTRVIDGLESGQFRVAEPDGQGGWTVNEWLKKAVLLYFRVNEMAVIDAQPAPFWDKVESRFAGFHEAEFRKAGVRVVPGAVARRGSYFGKDVVLMPSFTNIGAYVGEGTMVDTWATVGSCAQIGKHCHLSGGAGIGGVLEPLQASPTIIEDHCFIGARSEVVEGVVIGHHSVIGMGVFIGQSTRIYNRATGEISYGYVPPYSVVVSGQLPSKDGSHSLYCAVIVKQVDAKTRSKTSVNELLRGLAD